MAESLLVADFGGIYPERNSSKTAASIFPPRTARAEAISRQVAALEPEIAKLSAEQIKAEMSRLALRLRQDGLVAEHVIGVFAQLREIARRQVGQFPYRVQVAGAWGLLNRQLIEMHTGEGKTLTASLPACAAAMAGIPVHVITTNDYLAQRDANLMAPIYQFLGLTVGVVTAEATPQQRRQAYRRQITYCTAKQVAFDYLRDRLTLGRDRGALRLRLERHYSATPRLKKTLLPGLHFAIVDEADSVLIDEACTPLLISRTIDHSEDARLYELVLAAARSMIADQDFSLLGSRNIELKPAGIEKAKRTWVAAATSASERRWQGLVVTGLIALHLLRRDRDYLVSDRKIKMIDSNTGRVMPDHSWSRELQRLVELVQDCDLTQARETLARISYQRFFNRYLNLAGMTGTAREVRREIRKTYSLKVVAIPTRKPVCRQWLGLRIFGNEADREAALLERLAHMQALERPVLIGTNSVASAESMAQLLQDNEFQFRLLDARNDKQESQVIAQAGQTGVITVATNLAGRGTDIKLGPGVEARGGLHVIATELNRSRRIDRQLFGRCARQGDRGSSEMLLTLNDAVLREQCAPAFISAVARLTSKPGCLHPLVARMLVYLAQTISEGRDHRARRRVLESDKQLDRLTAVGGQPE